MQEELKIEIGRMLQEGVSDEGIQAVVEYWKREMSINPFTCPSPSAIYAQYVEYGLPPLDPNKTVEGSLAEQPVKMIKERGIDRE